MANPRTYSILSSALLAFAASAGCSGPRAYVGLASSYFEKITENFERMDDEQWSTEISAQTPDDVPWMRSVVVR